MDFPTYVTLYEKALQNNKLNHHIVKQNSAINGDKRTKNQIINSILFINNLIPFNF